MPRAFSSRTGRLPARYSLVLGLGLEVYSPKTGGCRDGLHVDRVNRNMGAESTLAFLLSLAEMRLMQNMLTDFKELISVEA